MDTTFKIKKAKLKGRSLEVELTETVFLNDEGGQCYNEVSKKCDALVHDDLFAAFVKLIPHVAMICDLREADLVERGDELRGIIPNIEVTGFSVSGSDENEGCVIIAQKKIGKRVLNLTTPFTKYADMEEYDYGGELQVAIDACIYEAQQYLNGKCAVRQLNLFEDDNPEGTFENLMEAPKKKGRKKKGFVIPMDDVDTSEIAEVRVIIPEEEHEHEIAA